MAEEQNKISANFLKFEQLELINNQIFRTSSSDFYSDDYDIESPTNSIEPSNLTLKEACPRGHINR